MSKQVPRFTSEDEERKYPPNLRLTTLSTTDPPVKSPLDVEGIEIGLTSDEIVGFIQEGRRQ